MFSYGCNQCREMLGSGLEGPIPSSISGLNSLIQLWVKYLNTINRYRYFLIIICFSKGTLIVAAFAMQKNKWHQGQSPSFSWPEQHDWHYTNVTCWPISVHFLVRNQVQYDFTLQNLTLSFIVKRVLRNCNITGEIPPYVWNLGALRILWVYSSCHAWSFTDYVLFIHLLTEIFFSAFALDRDLSFNKLIGKLPDRISSENWQFM